MGRYRILMARRWVIVGPPFSFMPEACRVHKWKWRANIHSTEGHTKYINALIKSHYHYYYQSQVRTSNEQRTTAIGLWFIPRTCDVFHANVVCLLQKQSIPCLHILMGDTHAQLKYFHCLLTLFDQYSTYACALGFLLIVHCWLALLTIIDFWCHSKASLYHR